MKFLLDGTLSANLNAEIERMMSSFVGTWLLGIGSGLLGVILAMRLSSQGRDMVLGLASSNPAAAMVPIFLPYLTITAGLAFWQVSLPETGMSWPGMFTRSIDYVVEQIDTLGG